MPSEQFVYPSNKKRGENEAPNFPGGLRPSRHVVHETRLQWPWTPAEGIHNDEDKDIDSDDVICLEDVILYSNTFI